MFTCKVCASTFIRKEYLSRHIKSIHDGVKFVCNVCLKSFTRKYNLNQHTKNAHGVSGIQYVPPIIVRQPPAATNICDRAIGNDELLEILNDFENQGKKNHYSNIYKILGR